MGSVFIFFADSIIALLFTSSYAEVVDLLPILGIYLVVINIAGLVDMLWVALRRGSVYMLTNLIFGAMLLVFLWHFSPSMGIIEFATATVVFHSLTIISLAILWMRAFRFRLSATRIMER
jgi:O-antigen/teichoic acid export membrane protein